MKRIDRRGGGRWVSPFLCAALLALLWACGGRADPLTRLRAAGSLRVALDPSFPPFEYVDGAGEVAGFDADMARELAARLGVEAHFVVTGYDGLYDALTVGRADVVISALYPDPARSHAFAFSPPYFDAGEVLLAPAGSDLAGAADCAGRRVALVFGSAGHVEALAWEERIAPPPLLLPFDTPEAALAALDSGAADAAIVDGVTAAAQRARFRVVAQVTSEPYVVAARMEDRALIDAVAEILAEMHADGTLDALRERWMAAPDL